MDTINKLLSKPAPKRRSRAEMLAAAAAAEDGFVSGAEDGEEGEHGTVNRRFKPADPVFSRWVQNREGSRLAFPEEWLPASGGNVVNGVFGGAAAAGPVVGGS